VKKSRIKSAIVIIAIIFLLCLFFYECRPKETVIEFAMFNGSNWGVAVQESYSVIDKAIEKFEKEHNGVKIKYVSGITKDDYSEWMSERILKDNMPDIFMVLDEDFEKYVNLGIIEKLDKYVLEDNDFDIHKYYTEIANSGVFAGHRYALPYEAMPTLMFVNRTLLENFHLDIPKNDYTFDDFYRACRMITLDRNLDGSPDYFGIYKYDWINAALSNDVMLFSKDGKKSYFNDEKLAESIRFVKSLESLNGNHNITKEEFDSGNVAFSQMSLAEYRTYKSYPYKIKKYTGFAWDCIPMPAGKSGNNVSMIDSLDIGISSKSKKKRLAWEFLKTLTYDTQIQQALYNDMPVASVLKEVMESKESENIFKEDEDIIDSKLICHILENGSGKPKFSGYEGAISLADAKISKLTLEDDIENALRILQREMSKYLLQERGKE
jgi:hypothetical protein